METVDASKLGTCNKGIEKSTAPAPKSAVANRPGHGTGRKP